MRINIQVYYTNSIGNVNKISDFFMAVQTIFLSEMANYAFLLVNLGISRSSAASTHPIRLTMITPVQFTL